jgi:hypothetical protein
LARRAQREGSELMPEPRRLRTHRRRRNPSAKERSPTPARLSAQRRPRTAGSPIPARRSASRWSRSRRPARGGRKRPEYVEELADACRLRRHVRLDTHFPRRRLDLHLARVPLCPRGAQCQWVRRRRGPSGWIVILAGEAAPRRGGHVSEQQYRRPAGCYVPSVSGTHHAFVVHAGTGVAAARKVHETSARLDGRPAGWSKWIPPSKETLERMRIEESQGTEIWTPGGA